MQIILIFNFLLILSSIIHLKHSILSLIQLYENKTKFQPFLSNYKRIISTLLKLRFKYIIPKTSMRILVCLPTLCSSMYIVYMTFAVLPRKLKNVIWAQFPNTLRNILVWPTNRYLHQKNVCMYFVCSTVFFQKRIFSNKQSK